MTGSTFCGTPAIAALFSAFMFASSVHAASADQIKALETRLRALEAKEEIRELFNRYAFTADTGDAKGWSEVWAEDAVYESSAVTIRGREAFFKSAADPNGTHLKDIVGKGSLHTTGPLTIRVDGSRAWAEGHTLVWVRQEQGYEIFALSYSHWDLRKTAGRWEIKRRVSRPVAPGHADLVFKAWRTVD